ncbi:hypothetical protein HY768_01525 [candidate division TA06 bacterium]|uniref:DUF2281 domain-containing protein n=1 Tax=candidate division TA06 bacterium TaxID=2250710 RepID=A0A933I783_UNCT6|nr:hypothetical protein [candidate division TA06 bacterium]
MSESIIRDRVMGEIKLIPEHKLSEVYDFIHYFRIGIQKSKGNIDQIMEFAGCWKDVSDDAFNDFLKEITQRRKNAFAGRISNEAGSG